MQYNAPAVLFHTENRGQMEQSTSRSCRSIKPERLQNRIDLFLRDSMFSLKKPRTSIRSGNWQSEH